jgi:hypothetical protein
MLIAVMIQLDLVGIYIQKQIRLTSKGSPRARVVQGFRYQRYDIDHDIIGHDVDWV